MRGTRWLLVLAILAILAGIGVTYRTQKRTLRSQTPAKPALLPQELSGLRDEFNWERRNEGRQVARLHARKARQEKDSNQVKLEQVELQIFSKDGLSYNLVKSANAEFSERDSRLYSEGDVEITLELPVDGPPERTPVTIRTSGVSFEVRTGKATTDRATSFTFPNGWGKAVGASYDPVTKELLLRSQVALENKRPGNHSVPMKVEAGEVVYKEAGSVVRLNQWSRLTRKNTVVNAGPAIVTLNDDIVRQVDAVKAQGTDEYPNRKLEYAADELRVTYSEDGEVERISGKTNVRVVSASAGSKTTVTGDFVDLDFETVGEESVLKKVLAHGHAAVESKPLAGPGGKLPETRVLSSEKIELQMRPGGREAETVRTQAPGRLEFLPNQPGQRHRTLNAENMLISYGPENQIQSFRGSNVETVTDPNDEERAKKRPVSKTRSKNMTAEFDGKGQVTRMEQWDDFAYEQGDRHARANRAVMEAGRNLITLEKSARVWDPTGATSADHIRLDEQSGDFSADGHVNSSRQPEKKKSGTEMLSGDQAVEAMADRMTAMNRNRQLHYEGHVLMWQGPDRITAESVDIDREKRSLTASGGVVTQFLDKPVSPGPATAGQTSSPAFVVVKADRLVYTEPDRLARYTGGAQLDRPALRVKSDELRVFLAEEKPDGAAGDSESRVEKAFADGHVEIVQTAPDRTRTGTGEHAEYYAADEKIVLNGGQPQLVDSKRGFTRGSELTYFVNDDRLLVSGAPGHRATSRLRRKTP
jgi:lipopolysaccharide export system protein LptA